MCKAELKISPAKATPAPQRGRAALRSARVDVTRGLTLVLRGISRLEAASRRVERSDYLEEHGRIAEALSSIDAALAEVVRRLHAEPAPHRDSPEPGSAKIHVFPKSD